jgi:Uncharacterized conserved protein
MAIDKVPVIGDRDHNRAVSKLSPFIKLSGEQLALKKRILAFCRAHVTDSRTALFVVQGDPGTGKSVLLSTVFNTIQSLARKDDAEDPLWHTDNVLLVNHPEMIKLYKEIAESLPSVRKKDFERPTTFINRIQKRGAAADIVLVDEAHLLLTRSDKYNKFDQANQLEEIIRHSHVVIMIFDAQQVLKTKSYWNQRNVRDFLTRFQGETAELTQQFRIHAYPDVTMWIKDFVHKKIRPFPRKQAFDFRIFNDAASMYQAIRNKNEKYRLARMVATYDYPYKLDGGDHLIHEKNFCLRWDRAKPSAKMPWAEREDTIDEVGSVYTVQGFDLNYAGVILGPSVTYDEVNDQIKINIEKYEDSAAFIRRKDLNNPDAVREQIILNSIYILMTRGVRGLYIYASNPALHRRLETLMKERVPDRTTGSER